VSTTTNQAAGRVFGIVNALPVPQQDYNRILYWVLRPEAFLLASLKKKGHPPSVARLGSRLLSPFSRANLRLRRRSFAAFRPTLAVASTEMEAACSGRAGFNGRGQDTYALRSLTVDSREGPRELRIRLAGGCDFLGREQRHMDRAWKLNSTGDDSGDLRAMWEALQRSTE